MNTNMLNIGTQAEKKEVGKYYRKLIIQKKTGGAGFEKKIELI